MPAPARLALIPAPLILAAACLALPAQAACDVAGAGIEETIARRPALQEPANAQTLRDLRTLRDAAIVLDAYQHAPECERLVAIVKALAADPDRAIEMGGDTDEERAEGLMEAREPRTPTAKAPLKAPETTGSR